MDYAACGTMCLRVFTCGHDRAQGVGSRLSFMCVCVGVCILIQSLSKEADSYDNTAAHVELAKKMKKRDPATAPQVGDRVPYVIIKAAKVRTCDTHTHTQSMLAASAVWHGSLGLGA